MNISVMNSKDNWNIFSKNRNAIYGVAIISIMIFHFFEDIANSNLSGGGLGFLGKLYNEYYGAAEPPVRCGESHLSGLTEPPQFVY